MTSVALKKGLEEPWTIESVAKFIVLRGFREITLKSDTDLATIAFRTCVAGTIKCHIETSTQEPLRDESPILPWLVDTHRMHPVQVSKRSRRENAIRKTARQETVTQMCPICGESVGKAKLHRSHEQNEPQMQVRDLAWNAKQQCMMFHEECRWCRAREIRILEPQSRWDKADGRWTVERPDIRVDPIPIPPLPCKGARIQKGENHQARHRRVRSHCWMPWLQRSQRHQKGRKPI